MRRILYIIAILIGMYFFSCKKDKPIPVDNSNNGTIDTSHSWVYSNCSYDTTIPSVLLNDAKHLALKLMQDSLSSFYDSVFIKQQLIDTVYHDLIGIFHTSLPARDSVFNIYNIYQWDPILTDAILFVWDSTKWAQQWYAGNFQTGNQTVDSLLGKYNLTVAGMTHHTIVNDYSI